MRIKTSKQPCFLSGVLVVKRKILKGNSSARGAAADFYYQDSINCIHCNNIEKEKSGLTFKIRRTCNKIRKGAKLKIMLKENYFQ